MNTYTITCNNCSAVVTAENMSGFCKHICGTKTRRAIVTIRTAVTDESQYEDFSTDNTQTFRANIGEEIKFKYYPKLVELSVTVDEVIDE